MTIKFTWFFLFSSLFLFASCSDSKDLNEFAYSYSMESVNNYKLDFELDSDSNFVITRQNYFFDRFNGTSKQDFKSGKLTRNDFVTFENLIQDSNIHKMKDSYGFDSKENSEIDIVYTLNLEWGERSKYVIINSFDNSKFSDEFIRLIKFTGDFINQNMSFEE